MQLKLKRAEKPTEKDVVSGGWCAYQVVGGAVTLAPQVVSQAGSGEAQAAKAQGAGRHVVPLPDPAPHSHAVQAPSPQLSGREAQAAVCPQALEPSEPPAGVGPAGVVVPSTCESWLDLPE